MTAFSLPSELDLSPDQLFGYLACALVLATFAMRSMQGLRYVAILSNIAFIYYAGVLGLTPIFILHAALLPLNLWRLIELWSNVSIGRHDKENDTRSDRGREHQLPDHALSGNSSCWLPTMSSPKASPAFNVGDVGRKFDPQPSLIRHAPIDHSPEELIDK